MILEEDCLFGMIGRALRARPPWYIRSVSLRETVRCWNWAFTVSVRNTVSAFKMPCSGATVSLRGTDSLSLGDRVLFFDHPRRRFCRIGMPPHEILCRGRAFWKSVLGQDPLGRVALLEVEATFLTSPYEAVAFKLSERSMRPVDADLEDLRCLANGK